MFTTFPVSLCLIGDFVAVTITSFKVFTESWACELRAADKQKIAIIFFFILRKCFYCFDKKIRNIKLQKAILHSCFSPESDE
jgi:hypothetical protein